METTNGNREVLENVRELEAKKLTFVKFVHLTSFLLVCDTVGLLTFGGAFGDDMTGQWFYI